MTEIEKLPELMRRVRGDRSAREVAKAMGEWSGMTIAHSTVLRWESGETTPPLPSLRSYLSTCEASIRDSLAAEAAWLDIQGKRGAA